MKIFKIFTLPVIFFAVFNILNLFESFQSQKLIVKLGEPPVGQFKQSDLWNATIINNSNETYRIYLYGTLTEKKAGLIATGTTTDFDVKNGTKQIKGSDFPQTPDITYPNKDPKYKEAMTSTGSLPPGEYNYCLYAKLKKTNEEVGNDCIDFTIEDLGMISLISPNDGEELDPKIPIIFTWMSSQIQRVPNYTLKIVEIREGQSPEVALQTNKSWFEKSDIKTPTFQYPKTAKPFEDGKKYAWTVKTGETKSEIFSFQITRSAIYSIRLIPLENCCYNIELTIYPGNILNEIQLKSVNSEFISAIPENGFTIIPSVIPPPVNEISIKTSTGGNFPVQAGQQKIYIIGKVCFAPSVQQISVFVKYNNSQDYPVDPIDQFICTGSSGDCPPCNFNILKNGNFLTSPNFPSSNNFSQWLYLSSADYKPEYGCCDNGYMSLHADKQEGNKVWQILTQQISTGENYKITFCARNPNPYSSSPITARIRVRASNGEIPHVTTNCEVIAITPTITPSTGGVPTPWTNYTYYWTAPSSANGYNTITVDVDSDIPYFWDKHLISHGDVDNICIEKIETVDCCTDFFKNIIQKEPIVTGVNSASTENTFYCNRNIISANATIAQAYMDLNCATSPDGIKPIVCNINSAQTNGFTTSSITGGNADFVCSQSSGQSTLNSNLSLSLPAFPQDCDARVFICIRWSFTDINCKNCDTLMCYDFLIKKRSDPKKEKNLNYLDERSIFYPQAGGKKEKNNFIPPIKSFYDFLIINDSPIKQDEKPIVIEVKQGSNSISSVYSGSIFTYTIKYTIPENMAYPSITDILPPELGTITIADMTGDANFEPESFINPTAKFKLKSGKVLNGIPGFPEGTPGLETFTTGTLSINVKFPSGTTPNGTIALNSATLNGTKYDGTNLIDFSSMSDPYSMTAIAENKFQIKKTWISGNTLNGWSTYRIDIINPNNSDIGGLNIINPEVTDIMPSNSISDWDLTSHFYNGTIIVSDQKIYNNNPNYSFKWTFLSELKVNNLAYTYSATIVIKYPQTQFSPGQEVTNDVKLNGTNPNNIPIELTAFSKIILKEVIGSKYGTHYSGIGRYDIKFRNPENASVNNFVVEDPTIPSQITISMIKITILGTYNTGPVNIFWKNSSGVYISATGNPYQFPLWGLSPGSLGVTGNLTGIKFNFGNVPVGFEGIIELNFNVAQGFEGTVNNCAKISYDYLGQHYDTDPFCYPLYIDNPPIPTVFSLSKYLEPANPTSFTPGSTIRFKLSYTLVSGTPMLGNMLTITDILPAVLDPMTITNCMTPYTIAGSNINFTVNPPLMIGMPVNIFFDVKVKNDAAPGTYFNECRLNGNPGNSVQFTINANTTLDATKEIKSTASNTFTNTGFSYQGEVFKYKVKLKNTFTTPVKNIKILDIFPYLNDTKVVTTNPRNSQWSPSLILEIYTGIPGVTTKYSTNSNICRSNLYVTGPSGCVSPVWMNFSDIPNVTDIKAVLFEFPSTYILNPNQEFSFQWLMKVPNGAPANLKAYNSFGYVAQRTDNNQMLLAAESQIVSVEVIAAEPIIIGDFVFNDMNQNGIQDIGEFGINGVEVELRNASGVLVNDKFGNPVVPTMTANNYSNQPGYYQFSNLNPGTYRLQFRRPLNQYFTSKNQGTDINKDSDADPNTGITDVFTLVAGTTDNSRDCGLTLTPVEACNCILSLGDVIINCKPGEPGNYTFSIPVTNNSNCAGNVSITSNNGQVILGSTSPIPISGTSTVNGEINGGTAGAATLTVTLQTQNSPLINCTQTKNIILPPCYTCSLSFGTTTFECKPDNSGTYNYSIAINNLSNSPADVTLSSSAGTLSQTTLNNIPANGNATVTGELTGASPESITITATMTTQTSPLLTCTQTKEVTLPPCYNCSLSFGTTTFECKQNSPGTYTYSITINNLSNCVADVTLLSSAGNLSQNTLNNIPANGNATITGELTGASPGIITLTALMTTQGSPQVTCNQTKDVTLPCCCKLNITEPTINCYQSPPTKNFNPCEWYDIKQTVTNASNCDGTVKIIIPNGNIIATSSISAGATQTLSFQLPNPTGQDMTVEIILTLSDGTICELPYTYHFPDCCICDFSCSNPVINCVDGNPGEYTFQVDITNIANYTLSLEPTISSSGTTIITSTWYQIPMGTTMLLTGKILNPTGPNVSITVTMKMPDNTTCQKTIPFTLPNCCNCNYIIGKPKTNCIFSNNETYYTFDVDITNTSSCDETISITSDNATINLTAVPNPIPAGSTSHITGTIKDPMINNSVNMTFTFTMPDGITTCQQIETFGLPCCCRFTLNESHIECKQDPLGNYYYDIGIFMKNSSSCDGTLTVTSNTGTLTVTSPPNSMWVTATLYGATGNTALLDFKLTMLDALFCHETQEFFLPPCPGTPPPDCCKDFIKTFTLDQKYHSGVNQIKIKTGVSTTQTQITEFSATIISAEVQYNKTGCGPNASIMGDILSSSSLSNFTGPNVLTPSSREATWYNWLGTTMNNNELILDVKFPPPNFLMNCYGVIKICVKYSFLDINCVRCEEIVCYDISIPQN